MIGKYNIVHVGRVNMFVRFENPDPVLQKFIQMLNGLVEYRAGLKVTASRSTISAAANSQPYGKTMDRYACYGIP
ncbi:hypothetical protein HYALB_00012028 [Hymenoscyphus albidus]|uniref:Uncharacterized protein n=1 Tax=Hymenoscyphus albidus TaxID=595503 RepID=A0A9N9Q237_9HELO|nr:hypothetical protein HYALB_00012028 [Hymenoscyphus albidus]